ncbi:MAG TPA: DUF3040 domain-containing protein [Beutenbergiaceae bacterium]|nr:DUF3040 domain-containing protein [Beutenbergiaceae bacterium]
MPLSEYEQRVLEQMEQQLRSDDPRLVEAITGRRSRRPAHMALGIVAVLAGLGALIGGVAAGQTWLGILGFLLMFGGVLLATRKSDLGPEPSQGSTGKSSSKRKAFMDRLDERWDDRRRNP